LDAIVQAKDIDAIVEGVEQGLSHLPELAIESSHQTAAGNRVEVERVLTFRDGSTLRRRRLRLIYDRDRLYTVMSQGETVGEYEYWLPMLNYCHLTFRVGLFSLGDFAP